MQRYGGRYEQYFRAKRGVTHIITNSFPDCKVSAFRSAPLTTTKERRANRPRFGNKQKRCCGEAGVDSGQHQGQEAPARGALPAAQTRGAGFIVWQSAAHPGRHAAAYAADSRSSGSITHSSGSSCTGRARDRGRACKARLHRARLSRALLPSIAASPPFGMAAGVATRADSLSSERRGRAEAPAATEQHGCRVWKALGRHIARAGVHARGRRLLLCLRHPPRKPGAARAACCCLPRGWSDQRDCLCVLRSTPVWFVHTQHREATITAET